MSVKDLTKEYHHHKEAMDRVVEKIKDMNARKETIERKSISLNENLKQAESEKKRALERFAFGEISQPEVNKTKEAFSKAQEAVDDSKEMLSALERGIADLQQQLAEPFSGLQGKTKTAETAIWKAIYNELAADLLILRDKIDRCYTAYRLGGGLHVVRNGHFLNEIFGNEDISREKINEMRDKLAKDYGL